MQSRFWIIGLYTLFLTTTAFAAPFQLGDTTIQVTISGSGRYTYVHLHENERASLQAASRVMHKRPGKLITLSHGGERMVRFQLNGQSYQFDPNRIYTDVGLRRTLAAHSASAVTPEALTAVKKLATIITSHLNGEIIALHNNANDTVLKYLPRGAFSGNAGTVAYFKQNNPHNFFIVTERRTFEALKSQGFNTVLQNNRQVADDGSLSVYAARHGMPYVNVEAAFGDVAGQTKMLNALP